jgi:DoxX-like family
MTTAYLVVTMVTIVANLAVGLADLARAGFVLANSAQVGVPRTWLPALGTLKIAGAVGLVLGLLGVRVVGVAAAIGLTAFFVGAIVVHLRARVLHNLGVPGAYLLLAIASLALAITHQP